MRTACSALVALALLGCHAQPGERPPLPPPEARVAAAMTAWGQALQRGDAQALDETEDVGGRIALVYVGVKAAASQVPDGAEAVEHTIVGIVLCAIIGTLFTDEVGYPYDDFLMVVPVGSLGPALAAAGLATPFDVEGKSFTMVPVPWDDTLGRLHDASERHRARLTERQAWTCQPTEIERTIAPTEPSLVRAAEISTHIFGGWLETVDAIWLVRARCATGPGLFVVTGHVDPDDGTVHDRILIATVRTTRPTTSRRRAPRRDRRTACRRRRRASGRG